MSKVIAITGATGRVGAQVVKLLSGQGHTLRLVARHADKLAHFAGPGVEIHAGALNDSAFLTQVLRGADVALLMMPADIGVADVPAHQDQIGLAQLEAIQQSGLRRVIFLSSVGGHTEDRTGIVAGLARQEQRLAALTEVDLLTLRPSYFMENLLGNAGMIKGMGINGSAIDGDKALPVIATRDIAEVAAQKLLDDTWSGHTILPLLGPRDYSMNEITAAIGTGIGNPALPYVAFPYAQAREAMIGMGITPSMADAYIGLSQGINEGVFNHEIRNELSTTPTTIETFVREVFAPAYQA